MAQPRLSRFNIASLAIGLAFLYLPILILVIYSFNASRLVTVWGGWSLRWYYEFFNDGAMIEAFWMSLRVAATSASIATLLGTLAAVALSRGENFRGRTLFSGMLYAPLVMPEVITASPTAGAAGGRTAAAARSRAPAARSRRRMPPASPCW